MNWAQYQHRRYFLQPIRRSSNEDLKRSETSELVEVWERVGRCGKVCEECNADDTCHIGASTARLIVQYSMVLVDSEYVRCGRSKQYY